MRRLEPNGTDTTMRVARWLRAAVAAMAAVALLATAIPAHAMHCGSRVISSGDDAAKLLRFCGEPASVQSHHIERTLITRDGRVYPGFKEEVLVEEWTYNFGPYQLMVKVRLENGVVTGVDYLGYGH